MKKKDKSTEDPKSFMIDMPEVKDIPGQEHVKPPRMSEMVDSTPSSSDEEGEGVLDELDSDNEEELFDDTDTDVTEEEIADLEQSDRQVNEETLDRRKLALDKDEDNEGLNEEGNPLDLGEDLDVPGSELDDEDEANGEEDEENNSYSTRD